MAIFTNMELYSNGAIFYDLEQPLTHTHYRIFKVTLCFDAEYFTNG